jgi:hypothetical protein
MLPATVVTGAEATTIADARARARIMSSRKSRAWEHKPHIPVSLASVEEDTP